MSEKGIDKWAVGQALKDLHFQTDFVRKCAAINDLLERAERDCFKLARLQNALKIYADDTNWGLVDSEGQMFNGKRIAFIGSVKTECIRLAGRIGKTNVLDGYDIAQAALNQL